MKFKNQHIDIEVLEDFELEKPYIVKVCELDPIGRAVTVSKCHISAGEIVVDKKETSTTNLVSMRVKFCTTKDEAELFAVSAYLKTL